MNENDKPSNFTFDIFTKFFSLVLTMDGGRNGTDVTQAVPTEEDSTGGSDKTGVSAGLVGAVLFIIVIIVIIVIRKKMHRSEDDSKDDSDVEMDSLSDVDHYHDSDKGSFDIIVTADGRKISRRTLKDDLWVEDPELRATIKQYLIEPNRVKLGSLLGKGQYGCVYEAKLSKDARSSNDYGNLTHERVAVKTLKGSDLNLDLVESFLSEGLLMRDFEHKHILGFLGVSYGRDGVPMIVLPYMSNGSLKKYVANPTLELTVRQLLGFSHQVALGMEYLAAQKFVHRDLAARNCMLDDTLTVKVADFGLSRDIYTKEYYSSEDKKAKLPVKWMAIESLTKNVYTSKSDVWSFGVLVWELMTRGVTPYPDITNWDIRHYVTSGRRLDKPEACPPEMYEIMKRCWSSDPKARPTFSMLVKEIQEILDWDKPDERDSLYINVCPSSPSATSSDTKS